MPERSSGKPSRRGYNLHAQISLNWKRAFIPRQNISADSAVISRTPLNGAPGLSGAVLIIDDEAGIRESLQTLLEMEGYAVETAVTGEAGLRSGLGSILLILSCSISRCPVATVWKFWPNSHP